MGCGRPSAPLFDEDGKPMHSIGVRPKTITTLLGKITFRRSVFRNDSGTLTNIPLDEAFGVEGTAFSPGVRRMMARAGSRTSFTDASEDRRPQVLCQFRWHRNPPSARAS